MEQNKKNVTISVTEDGKEIASITDNNVFIVSNERGFMSTSCTSCDLLEFAVKIQAYFFQTLMPRVMEGTKLGVTEDMIFNVITDIAKNAVSVVDRIKKLN